MAMFRHLIRRRHARGGTSATIVALVLPLAACVAPGAVAPGPGARHAHPEHQPCVASAQDAALVNEREAGDMTAVAGLGFTSGPSAFLLGGELDFQQSERFSIGPMLQLGMDDDVSMVAASLQGKYHFPLTAADGRLVPFAQGGLGFLWMEKDRPGGDADDLGLMLQAGGGVEWHLDERFFLASAIVLDLMPADVLDEHLIFTWQLIQLGFRL